MLKQTSSWCWNQPGEPTDLVQTITDIPALDCHQILVANRVIGLMVDKQNRNVIFIQTVIGKRHY